MGARHQTASGQGDDMSAETSAFERQDNINRRQTCSDKQHLFGAQWYIKAACVPRIVGNKTWR
jgi:hypothetical protein